MELIYRTLIATFCSCCLCSFLDSYLGSSFLDFFDSCSLLLLYLLFLDPVSCVIAAVVFSSSHGVYYSGHSDPLGYIIDNMVVSET